MLRRLRALGDDYWRSGGKGPRGSDGDWASFRALRSTQRPNADLTAVRDGANARDPGANNAEDVCLVEAPKSRGQIYRRKQIRDLLFGEMNQGLGSAGAES